MEDMGAKESHSRGCLELDLGGWIMLWGEGHPDVGTVVRPEQMHLALLNPLHPLSHRVAFRSRCRDL